MAENEVTRAAWYYAHGGRQTGPVDLQVLVKLAALGQLRPEDLVWTNGMAQWTPAGALPVFGPSFRQAAWQQRPPLPPPAVAQPTAPGAHPAPADTAMRAKTPLGYQGAPQAPYPGAPHQPGIGDDAATRWLLPVGRSGLAIAAGYLGLFSVLACPGPIALIVSILAIRDLRAHPHKHGMGRAVFGLVMGIIGTAMLTLMTSSFALGR
jgi:hypothetical protein